jgi:hypothetical protein
VHGNRTHPRPRSWPSNRFEDGLSPVSARVRSLQTAPVSSSLWARIPHVVPWLSLARMGFGVKPGVKNDQAPEPWPSGLCDALVALLGERLELLVLDNFGYIQTAASEVRALLAGCPGLKVLATCSGPTRLRWEHQILVPPLALTDRGTNADVARLHLRLRGAPGARSPSACSAWFAPRPGSHPRVG